jgi:hypothetical protein
MKTTLLSIGQPLARLGNFVNLLCAAAILGAAASTARASDPNGIYGFVDRVVFEPNDAAPERVQVWGGFALAVPRSKSNYEYRDAERGYLYFKLRAGDEETCKKEWADFKAVAGTGQIVSFGSRYDTTPVALRKADAKAENPDTYPKSWGMNKVRARDYGPINQLNKLQGKKSDAPAPPPKSKNS